MKEYYKSMSKGIRKTKTLKTSFKRIVIYHFNFCEINFQL